MSRRRKLQQSVHGEIPLSPLAIELKRQNDRLVEMSAKGLTHRQASAIYEAFKREAQMSGEWNPGAPWKVGV